MQDLVIGNGVLVTLGENNRIIPRGCLAIHDGRIAEIGAVTDFVGKYPGARFIDARGRLIMPGFINAHMHFYASLARGMAMDDYAPKDVKDVLEGLWWRFDKALNLDDVRFSALVALMDCVRKGTTTVIDRHASPNAVGGSLDAIAAATTEAGVRACLSYEVSDRDGKTVARQGIEENERFLKRLSATPDDRLAGAFGLHASFTAEDETLKAAAAVCAAHNAPLHANLAEGSLDNTVSLERFHARPLARFERAGLLERPALLAHGVHLEKAEHATLAQRAAWLLHTPQSDLNNAVGTAPVPHMLGEGIRVALGTDGMTSDMLQELRAFGLVHQQNPRFEQLVQVFCVNNARLASELFKTRVGVLEADAVGDVLLVDYVPPTNLTVENFGAHLFHGIVNARVDTTICGGRLLMHQGKLLTLDEEEITRRSRELAQRMWQRVE